jgi:hypothetical protein
MSIASQWSQPASYTTHNGTNFNLPVRAVGVNVGTDLTNVNLKLQPSRAVPWTTVQRNSQPVAIARSLSLHMDAHSPTPQVSPTHGGQTPSASPSLHQQQMVSRTGATYLGFITGNPRVGNFHTTPVTHNTVPATGTGTHHTRLHGFYRGVTITCQGLINHGFTHSKN